MLSTHHKVHIHTVHSQGTAHPAPKIWAIQLKEVFRGAADNEREEFNVADASLGP